MLEDAKNPDNTVMGLLCLAVSLLGGQLNCISQILCASEPFQPMLALVRFVHSCTKLNNLPVLCDTFASWKATRDDLTHSCTKAIWTGSAGLLKPIQVYKSQI